MKLFLVSNSGLHPVNSKLKKLYGEDIVVTAVTEKNTPLNQSFASDVAKMTKEIVTKFEDYEIYIVFSGLPIYNLVVFQTVQRILGKTPTVLIYDRDSGGYMEFNLDVRQLLFT